MNTIIKTKKHSKTNVTDNSIAMNSKWITPKALSQYRTNFYGNKRALLTNIADHIPKGTKSILDLFGGSGILSFYLKRQGYQVHTNDIMRYPFFRFKSLIQNNNVILNNDDLDLLREPNPNKQNYLTRYYGQTFGESNCQFLKTWAANIERLDDPVKKDIAVFIPITVISRYLKYAAINFSPLGTLTGNQDLLDVDLEKEVCSYALEIFPEFIFDNGFKNECYQRDAVELVSEIEADVAYIDSPYSCRGGAYESCYAWLDDLASILSGHGEIIDNPYDAKSDLEPYTYFGNRKSAITGFAKLFERSRHIPHIILSYNTTSDISPEEIMSIAKVYRNKVSLPFRKECRRPITNMESKHRKTEEIIIVCE